MKRRTQNIFFPTQRFDERYQNDYEGFSGGEFFEHLLDTIIDDKEYEYEITLVGHSMGTMVLNNALKLYQSKWIESRALKNIVYMAAAASIDDSLNTLVPFLVPANPQQTVPAFYNLTLNRVAEVSETHLLGLIPTGSLLVSIDQHFENPEHPMRRTFGSEVNVLSALNAIAQRLQGAEGTIVFKAFDRHPKSIPSTHGGFNEIEYWKKSTWSAHTKTDFPSDREDTKRFNAYIAVSDNTEGASSCDQTIP